MAGMTDGASYVPYSCRISRISDPPRPRDLLSDEDVNKILDKIKGPYADMLIRHMQESERSAYCMGFAAGKKEKS